MIGNGDDGRFGQRQCLKATRGQWLKRSTRLAAPSALPPLSASSTAELVALGLGVDIVPLFLADGRNDVVRLTDPID